MDNTAQTPSGIPLQPVYGPADRSAEPPAPGNPLLGVDLPNFILTPHVAWASREAMQSLAGQLIDNVEAFARGAPRNVVT